MRTNQPMRCTLLILFVILTGCRSVQPVAVPAATMELIDRILGAGGRGPDRVEALPQMHNARKGARSHAEELALLEDLCETMKFGSLCALGGFTPYPVLSALRHWPEDFGLPAREPEPA